MWLCPHRRTIAKAVSCSFARLTAKGVPDLDTITKLVRTTPRSADMRATFGIEASDSGDVLVILTRGGQWNDLETADLYR